jgi:hypothetical protein
MLLPLVVLALAAICFLNYYWMPKHDANEPPVVSSSIPYVGHIIGLWQHGSRYYEFMRYLPDMLYEREYYQRMIAEMLRCQRQMQASDLHAANAERQSLRGYLWRSSERYQP